MKALLIGSLVAIIIIIGGAVTFMIMDSANTVDSKEVFKASSATPVDLPAIDSGAPTDNGETGTSAKDQLDTLKANEQISNIQNSSKVGFTLGYQARQGPCDDLIELLEADVEDAEEKYKDAKKAYEKAQDRADGLEDGDEIEEAQKEIKEKKEELDDAEDKLFAEKEKLIRARTTCQS